MQVVKNIQKHKSSILLVAEKAKKVENPYELAEPAERKRATRLAISILPLTIRKANWSMTLDLSHNTIDANGVENIMAVLPKEIDFGATALEKYRYNLEKLECAIQTKNLAESYTELGKKMCEDNFTSTNLDLSFFTAEKSIAPLCTPLRTSITIQSIHLSNCGIDDKKCIQIAAMLKSNTSLTELSLDHNQVTNMGAAKIFAALIINQQNKIKVLDLAYNQLNDRFDKNTSTFISFFKKTKINTLYLDHNQIGDGFARIFASSIKNNLHLTGIFLSHNKITNTGALAIAKILIKIVHLENKLDLQSKTESEQEPIRVIARAGTIVAKKISETTDKNILVVRIFDEVERLHKNYIFLSAGLGGAHPKVDGGSASHSEQIWMGIQDFFVADNKKIEWAYSTKEACDKNNSIPTGCRTIPGNEMGMSPDVIFYSSAAYKTGGKKQKTSPKKLAAAHQDKLRRQNSRDYLIKSDAEFRGKDLKKIEEIKMSYYPPQTSGIDGEAIATAKRK